MKKEDEVKLNKILKNIIETDELIKKFKNKFYLGEAKKFGTGSHIILSNEDKGNKFMIIRISEEQYKELKNKKK